MPSPRKRRPDDEGKGTYVLHNIKGNQYWYRHYRSKVTKKVVAVREDPPRLREREHHRERCVTATQHIQSDPSCVTPLCNQANAKEPPVVQEVYIPRKGELTHLPIVNLARRRGYKARFALKEENLIKKYTHSPCLHLFCGVCELGDVRVDLNPKSKATVVQDVFEFLNQNGESFETVIYDPLYSANIANKFARDYNLDRQKLYYYDYGAGRSEKTHALHQGILACHPRFINCKSWNFVSFWRDNGYYLIDGFLGIWGGFRRPTYLLVFERRGRKFDAYLPKNKEGHSPPVTRRGAFRSLDSPVILKQRGSDVEKW